LVRSVIAGLDVLGPRVAKDVEDEKASEMERQADIKYWRIKLVPGILNFYSWKLLWRKRIDERRQNDPNIDENDDPENDESGPQPGLKDHF